MRALKIYRGIGLGDMIKVNSNAYPNKKLAKVLHIYKKNSNIRFVVQLAGNIRIDVHESAIMYSKKDSFSCSCKMQTLMREGCICGGD